MKFKKLKLFGVAVLGGLVMALGAVAADPQVGGSVANLTHVQGTVLVNHGKDYVNARPGTPLAPGARVLTMDKSSATVVYTGACVKQIKENGLLVVRGPADCQTAGAEQAIGPFYAAAIGATAAGSDADKDKECNVKEGEQQLEEKERERCCACCDKERGEEREQCCEKDAPDEGCCKREEGDERDKCCAGCVPFFWLTESFWAGTAITVGGAVLLYNSDRNDKGVSPQ